MNIDLMLNEIATFLPDYNEFFDSIILSTMTSIFKDRLDNIKTAIVCCGKHTQFLRKDFASLLNSKDIIDNNVDLIRRKNCFKTSNIYGYENINNYDLLIISSYEFRDDVKSTLIKRNFSGNILDIYDELSSNGIVLSKEYYQYKNDPYSLLIIGLDLLKRENSHHKKGKIFSLIISLFIKNKDILQAKKYLNIFLQEDYLEKEKYTIILEKIISLEEKIHMLLRSRKQKDIICFWQDDLRYVISKKMPYLNLCRKKGIDFTNAYGTSISTRSTYGCIMERTDEIDLYLNNAKKNQLVDLLEHNGYKAFRIGGKGICDQLEEYDYRHEIKLSDYETATTVLFWEAIKVLLTESSPVFILIHSLLETHPPFYAPTLDSYTFDYQLEGFRLMSKENLTVFEENALNAAKYLDEENEYLNFLLAEKAVKIYMSDHGCVTNKESRPYKDELSHIPFIVVGDEIRHIEENRLFSLRNFYEVINYIITLDGYEEIFKDYLQISGIDFYNINSIQGAIDLGMAELGIQYVGIRTLEDLYIYRATGEECYYILPNENDNLINNRNYIKRIELLKSLMKKEMIDINKVDKFKNSKRLYDIIGKPLNLYSKEIL